MDEAGIVYARDLVERLGRLARARTRAPGPERVRRERELREPTLELALELLDAQSTSIASPNE